MNLFSAKRKAHSRPSLRFDPTLLPALKTESDPEHLYVVPRVRAVSDPRGATDGRALHLDNAAQHDPRVVLVGASGMGKTSALNFIAARERASVISFADFHLHALPANFENASWILLDDVSEAAHVEHIARLADKFPNARIFAASRSSGSDATLQLTIPNFTTLELQPLNERELISFAEAWFPLPLARRGGVLPPVRRANRAAESFIASVRADAGTRELATNPLFLFLLLQIYSPHPVAATAAPAIENAARRVETVAVPMAGSSPAATPFDVPVRVNISRLPVRRAPLFDAYVKAYANTNPAGKGDPDFAVRALEGIALSTKRGQIAKEEHLARGYGLLRERANGRVEFKHSLLQDFLAARALRRNPDLAPLREHLFDPAWREVVSFYAGLGDPRETVQAILDARRDVPAESLSAERLYLAAEALAAQSEPPPDLAEQVVKPLAQRAWEDEDERAMNVLGTLRSNMATDFFAAKLRERNPELRQHAAYVLGKLHTDRALEYLLPQLRDNSPDVRDQVVASLGQSRSERVIEPLLVALRGDPRVGTTDTRMRVAAATALGNVGTDKAVPALIVDLQVGEPEVRTCAVESLNQIRGEFAIKPLTSLVETHQQEEVRIAAAQVLAAMEGK